MTIDWSAVQGVAAVLALIVNLVVAYSLLVSIRALRETQAAKESAIYIWALDRVREIRPTMNEIRDAAGELPWLEANQTRVLQVIDVMQMISFMAEEGLIERRRIVDMWGKSIVEQWTFLEPFVKRFRKRIGESDSVNSGAFFARSFETLAQFSRQDLQARFDISFGGLDGKLPLAAS
jgi:hypothetical protein